MTEEEDNVVKKLRAAFGGAEDVTPAAGQPLHVLLPSVDLPDPWKPSPARALTNWNNWPTDRPLFYVDQEVVGEQGEPPRSNSLVYVLGEPWRQFSFTFPWVGTDPVRAVQLWMTRFVKERS